MFFTQKGVKLISWRIINVIIKTNELLRARSRILLQKDYDEKNVPRNKIPAPKLRECKPSVEPGL